MRGGAVLLRYRNGEEMRGRALAGGTLWGKWEAGDYSVALDKIASMEFLHRESKLPPFLDPPGLSASVELLNGRALELQGILFGYSYPSRGDSGLHYVGGGRVPGPRIVEYSLLNYLPLIERSNTETVVSMVNLADVRSLVVPDPERPEYVQVTISSGANKEGEILAGYIHLKGVRDRPSPEEAESRFLLGINRAGVWKLLDSTLANLTAHEGSSDYPIDIDDAESMNARGYQSRMTRYGYFGERGRYGGRPFAILFGDARAIPRGDQNILITVAGREEPIQLRNVSPTYELNAKVGDADSTIAFDKLSKVVFAHSASGESSTYRKAEVQLASGTPLSMDVAFREEQTCGYARAFLAQCVLNNVILSLEILAAYQEKPPDTELPAGAEPGTEESDYYSIIGILVDKVRGWTAQAGAGYANREGFLRCCI